MVHSTAPNSPSQGAKSLDAIKEEARKLAFPDHQQLGSQPAQNGQDRPAPAQTNGHDGPRGLASLPAKPAGFSQTGELVGNGPAHVLPDPNNPSLPPRDVSRAIPCRFFPSCKYGDLCVFAHIPPSESAELAKPAPMSSASPASAAPVGGFYYPGSHPPPPFPFPPQDPHSNQGGMPVPLEYAHYMGMGMPYGANGAPYYQPASTAQYGGGRGNPYAQPFSPYGYMMPPPHQMDPAGAPQANGSPAAKAPQYSPSNGSPEQGYATFVPQQQQQQQNGVSSPPLGPPVDMYQPPVQNGIPHGYGMPNGAAVFHPQQPYPQASAQQGQAVPSAPRQHRADAVMAASGMQGGPASNGGPNRKRGSISLNTSTNRRSGTASAITSLGPLANGGPYPRVGRPLDYDPSKPGKKRSQIPCAYFSNNDCRNGDACDFSHLLPDGTDAKQLKQNIIGVNGGSGDPRVLEDFRQHKEVKDREWRSKGGRFRDSSFPAYENRGRERFAHQNGEHQAQEPRHSGAGGPKYRQHSQSQQRVPNGADFPALPGTPRSESAPRQGSASPEPTSDTDDKMASSIASLMSVDSKPLGSFASAAARAAHVPQPPAPARKVAAATTKSNDSSMPHSPITTAQNLSPDVQASPVLPALSVAA